MRKWLYRLSLLIFGLFFAYWLTIKAVFSWIQYFPEHFLEFSKSVTGFQVSVDSINVRQAWNQVDVELKDFSISTPDWIFTSQVFKADLNVFSIWLPKMRYGKNLYVEGTELTIQPSLNSSETDFDLFDMQINPEQWPIHRFWQTVRISDLVVIFNGHEPIRWNLKLLQSYFGLKWSFGGLSSLSIGDELATDFQFKGDFVTNIWNFPEDGEATLDVLSPLNLEAVYGLLPEAWGEKLPIGEFLGGGHFTLKQGRLDYLRLFSRVQDLFWPKNDDILPKSIALALSVEKDRAASFDEHRVWHIELEKIRLDNEFVKAVSPVRLTFNTHYELKFETDQFELHAVKPMVDLLLTELDYPGVSSALQKLKLHKVKGLVDLSRVTLPELYFEIPVVYIQETENLPGLVVEDMRFDKRGHDVSISLPEPVQLYYQLIRPTPIIFTFNKPLQLKVNEHALKWKLFQQEFLMDKVPVKLKAERSDQEGLDLLLNAEPKTIARLKEYLPYSIMGAELEDWLKTALVSGENVRANLQIKGDLSEFPFRQGQGIFKATATVDQAKLQFQPDWPAVEGFSAKLEFVPYHLKITAKNALLDKVQVRNVEVNLKDLDSKNIAVDIQGQARADAAQAIEFLNQTPLTRKLELDEFLIKRVKATGNVDVTLEKVWVPVYGFNNRSEQVNGEVNLEGVQASLFDLFRFEDLQGKIRFTENSVFTKRPVQFVFEGGSAKANIRTVDNIIRILGGGNAHSNFDELSGTTEWSTKVDIPMSKGKGVEVYANLNLENLTSQLPPPYMQLFSNQAAQDDRDAEIRISFSGDDISFKGTVGDMARFHGDWPKSSQKPTNFKAALGVGQSFIGMPVEPGYAVKASFDQVDLDAWIDVFTKYGFFDDSEASKPISWHQSFIYAKDVHYSGQRFSNTQFNWNTLSQEGDLSSLAFKFSGDDISLVGTQTSDGGYDIFLDQLKLQMNKDPQPEKCDISNSVYPPINFVGENIKVGDRLIRKASFKLEDANEIMHVKELAVDFGRVNGTLRGEYQYFKQRNLSDFKASLKTKNVEDLTDFVGIKKGFTGKQGKINASVQWSGDLSCYDLVLLDGKVDFEVKDGVIQGADPGIARVLGLLSFEALARRVKLDIKDITDKGLVYNSIKGKGKIKQGVFDLQKLDLKAPAASASVLGKIDLNTETLDLSAEITPAIGNTLPAVAIISGIATPIAGLATYALLKVVPIVNEDLVTYRYEVSGKFSDPVIKDKGLSLDVIRTDQAVPDNPEDILEDSH